MATSAEGRQSHAPPGIRDEHAVAAESPVEEWALAQARTRAAVPEYAEFVRRCRLTPEVFTGTQGASRSPTATVDGHVTAAGLLTGRVAGCTA
ncbi:hypothetical protein GCM10010270_43170 [Streptomyces violaceus]|nr:hypothetical protein GCM10010270_43170 [Streptomyces janthinus]